MPPFSTEISPSEVKVSASVTVAEFFTTIAEVSSRSETFESVSAALSCATISEVLSEIFFSENPLAEESLGVPAKVATMSESCEVPSSAPTIAEYESVAPAESVPASAASVFPASVMPVPIESEPFCATSSEPKLSVAPASNVAVPVTRNVSPMLYVPLPPKC